MLLNCGFAVVGMSDQVRLMHLALAREEGGQHGDSDAAAEIADEVADTGHLVALVAGNCDIAEDAYWYEDERQT